MRGLAFPSNAVFDREDSYDRDYVNPHSGNAIPIDPALSGPAIDPTIIGEGSGTAEVQAEPSVYFQHPQSPPHRQHSHEPRQYSQGPQGDPFAPQPAQYLPTVEEVQPAPSPKPAKRKRRPRREEECGFCQGNDSKNKDGDAEPMVSCEECGRSGHPSCMELGEVSEVVRSYAWKCIECKICEICQEKGDDNRILFCDFCDRGWHMDCLQPPLEESPPGRWHCPMCPPLLLGPEGTEYFPPPEQEIQPIPEDGANEETDPSSSRPCTTHTSKRKGKQKAILTDDDSDVDMEEEEEEEEEEEGGQMVAKGRRIRKASRKGRGHQDSDDEEPALPKRSRLRVTSPAIPRPRMVVRLRLPAKGKGKEREEDDGPQKGLFDDILSAEDRDTTKTTVEFGDKQRFEKSRLASEEKLAPPAPPVPDVLDIAIASTLYRPLRSSTLHRITIPSSIPTPGMSASPGPSTPGSFSVPAAPPSSHTLRIRTIRFGEFDIQTWYDAPFPEEYATIPDGRLWICEFCLKYMKSRFGAGRHRMKCKARHPPGDEIYRDGAISVFEVDGRKNKIYCQNLCLLSKMFLDHKSLFYDVEPFLFYVMTEVDDTGARFVGYFSKEKRSPKDYNVSCIMTLPVRQRQGWGNLLIDFSYLLSKKEQRVGSPEKPLSGLGALGYKNYWTLSLMRYLDSSLDNPRLEDISVATSMTIEDIHTTLKQQNMISSLEVTPPPVRPFPGQSIKFPKGRKHGIARRHLQRTQTNDDVESKSQTPFSPPTHYEIRWDRDRVTQYLATWEAKGYLKLKPEKLKWSPFLLARTKKTDGLQTLATDSLENIDPITITNTPIPIDSPTTPQNHARQASVTVSDNNAIASSSHGPLDIKSQSHEQDQSNDANLPIFQSPDRTEDNGRSMSHDIRDIECPPMKRSRGRPRGSAIKRTTNGDLAAHELLTIGYRTRSESTRASELEQSVADDEALAAKLALEERRPTRSLRVRPTKTPELTRAVSTTSVTASSPRKRRRVESSPESEGDQLPTNVSANGAARNGSTSTPRHQRKTSRLLNGSGAAQDSTHTLIPLSPRTNIVPQPPLPAPTKPVVTDPADEAFGNSESVDVKSEPATTPVTGWTNRQSVPSDDTTIVAEAVNDKDPDRLSAAMQATETPDHGSHIEQTTIEEDARIADDLDAEGDADADGDEDLDAEGEIDAEGELDVEVTF